MKGVKRAVLALLISILCLGAPAIAIADTVYYKGTAVFWNYGRNAQVFGFSDCNSQVYEHSSSANGYSSGWCEKGVLSKAWGFIGTDVLQAYWNCRG